MKDLKAVYSDADEPFALDVLDTFSEKVRMFNCTTNTIEGFNRQLRNVTKAKSAFPTDDSLFKTL